VTRFKRKSVARFTITVFADEAQADGLTPAEMAVVRDRVEHVLRHNASGVQLEATLEEVACEGIGKDIALFVEMSK
jgi:hypothetical protein